MRRSGTIHMSATATYRTMAIQGRRKANGIETAYTSSDNLPFVSLPTARASFERGPVGRIVDLVELRHPKQQRARLQKRIVLLWRRQSVLRSGSLLRSRRTAHPVPGCARAASDS